MFFVVLLTFGTAYAQASNDPNSLDFPETPKWTQYFVKNNSGLQFANPNWNVNNFIYYLLQDGLYMETYSLVSKSILTLCPNKPNATRLYERLSKGNFSLIEYEKFFGIKYLPNEKVFSKALTKYYVHYAKQSTCAELISAMLPCLCLYPTIVDVLMPQKSSFNILAQKWLDYNKSSGTSCKIAQNLLVDLGLYNSPPLPSYEESVRLEYEFFALEPPKKCQDYLEL